MASGLEYVTVRPKIQHVRDIVAIFQACQKYNLRGRASCLQTSGCLYAIQFGHLDVQDDDVRSLT